MAVIGGKLRVGSYENGCLAVDWRWPLCRGFLKKFGGKTSGTTCPLIGVGRYAQVASVGGSTVNNNGNDNRNNNNYNKTGR